jgi:hypothetical protein
MKWAASMILLHTEVRWLPWGNVLSRLFELRSEVQIFLFDITSDLSNRFINELWLSRLAYLPDIFCRLSELNNSLQGFRTTPFSLYDKTKAFRKQNLFSLLKKQKVEKCLPFHFWPVSSVKMKFN